MTEVAQNTQVTGADGSEPPRRPRPPAPPKIRMDKSRHASEIHGVRTPDDLYYGVHFIQDGLLYNAEHMLIVDHPLYDESGKEGDKRRAALAKKMKRHMADASRRASLEERSEGDPDDVDDDEIDGDEEQLDPINLSDWVRGTQQVEWNEVTQAIAQRYKKRISSIADAIPFLVKEGVCPAQDVARKYKKYLD